MELVSIIVPIYNVEKYLVKCVESLCNQTYKNIEIILVDDGAKDSSPQLCDELLLKDNRIITLHKENGGLSDARNYGLQYANGDYIMFVDSDDYVAPEFVEKALIAAQKTSAEMVVFDFLFADENDIVNKKGIDFQEESITPKIFFEKILKDDYWKYIPAWNKIYKKSLLKNIRFEKGKLHEDEFFIHHVVGCCTTITVIPDCLYYYIQRGGSITKNITEKNRIHKCQAYLDRIVYFEKNNEYNSIIDGTFRNYLYKYIDFLQNCCDQMAISKMKEETLNTYKRVKKYLSVDTFLRFVLIRLKYEGIFKKNYKTLQQNKNRY